MSEEVLTFADYIVIAGRMAEGARLALNEKLKDWLMELAVFGFERAGWPSNVAISHVRAIANETATLVTGTWHEPKTPDLV
jgi:hypothetical protein